MFNIKTLIDDLTFNCSSFEELAKQLKPESNPRDARILADICADEELHSASDAIMNAIAEHNKKEIKVTSDEMKEVYLQLKDRHKNPRGSFDKAGRFYLIDIELVDVRNPSSKYPYTQMDAGRTAKFVKSLAEKYKCQSKDELEQVAFS